LALSVQSAKSCLLRALCILQRLTGSGSLCKKESGEHGEAGSWNCLQRGCPREWCLRRGIGLLAGWKGCCPGWRFQISLSSSGQRRLPGQCSSGCRKWSSVDLSRYWNNKGWSLSSKPWDGRPPRLVGSKVSGSGGIYCGCWGLRLLQEAVS